MARWQPAKKDVLDALAAEILHNYGKGRVIVGVDGDSHSGASGVADDLATTLREGGRKAFRASMTNFHRSRSSRDESLPDSPETYYDRAFDYSVFQRVLIDPFRSAGSTSFVLAAFDEKRDTAIQPKWMSSGADATLIVDGVFLNRPELAGLWNYTIYVETDVETDVEGAEAADAGGVTDDGDAALADALYVQHVSPRSKAIAIIDNSDPEHPLRRFADSC
jgi:uridine kinase